MLTGSGSPKTESKRQLVSDSIATGLFFALVLTVGQRVIGFGRGILFCRLMTDQQLGQWSMVWSYLMLLAPLAVLGLPGCFGKYSEYYRQRGQLRTFVFRIAWISAITTCLLATLIFLFPETVSWILFRDTTQASLTRWIAVALVFVTASNFLSCLMESLRQVRTVTLMRFLTGVVFAIAGVGLLYATASGSTATTIGFSVACLVGSVPAVWILWRYRDTFTHSGDQLTHRSMWQKIAPFAIWLWAANLLNNLFEVSDRYMLIHWSNTSPELAQGSVGQYHSGRVVPLLLVSVAAMLASLLMPYMSEAWESGKKAVAQRQLNWTVKLVSLGFTVGGVLILMLSPILFDTILQGRYNDGLAVLPLTLVYCIWFSLHTVGQDYLWVAEKGKWATAATGIGLIVNLAMNVILIPWLGLMGAVMATAAGNIVIVLAMFTLNHLFGCKTDLGIWLSAAMPLILLLGTWPAAFAAGVLALVCFGTNWVFTADEKADVYRIVREKLSR
ncbi:MAG: oligosaccharide flippase family protein [Planctomycetota bacterium]